jgi:hypothetical protein
VKDTSPFITWFCVILWHFCNVNSLLPKFSTLHFEQRDQPLHPQVTELVLLRKQDPPFLHSPVTGQVIRPVFSL